MGSQPTDVSPMRQTGLRVLPTRTEYTLEAAGVRLLLCFMTPALPDDLDLLSRPVTYVTCEWQATDGQSHEIEVYLDASAELTVNTPDQRVQGAREQHDAWTAIRIGSVEQPILAKKGDDLRIDWGFLYVVASNSDTADDGVGGS